jgi:DNA-directed RNA polymerase specialized sigma24 family protein
VPACNVTYVSLPIGKTLIFYVFWPQSGSMAKRENSTLSRQSFGEAYEQGSTRTVNFLMSKGFPEDEAREAAQAAWVRGWERRYQIRKPEKVLPWVNTIALNLGRTQLRKQLSMQPFEDQATKAPDLTVAADLEKMLGECRKKDRLLLTRRYLLGWGIDDLARHLDCTNRSIRVRLHRARKALRQRFQPAA